jgi:hypothetical protein
VLSLARFLWLEFCMRNFSSLSYKDAWNVLQIVNIGSGVSVLAVYGPSNYRRISGTRSVIMFPHTHTFT